MLFRSGRRSLVDLKSVVKRVVAEFEREFLGATIKIHQRLNDVPKTLANESQVATIVRTLIKNSLLAVKLQSKKEISISLDVVGKKICLKISDSGIGITEEAKGRIFEPFFSHAPGEGLGLMMPQAYSIAKNHLGSVSINPDFRKGNELVLTLPVDITARSEKELAVYTDEVKDIPKAIPKEKEPVESIHLPLEAKEELSSGLAKLSPVGVQIRRPKVKDLQI